MGILKVVLERTLTSPPLPSLARRRVRSDALVLAYHNVIPDDADSGADPSLHLRASVFARQLDALGRNHRVVGLSELLREPTNGGGRPRVAITFDDAYRGALQVGVAELATRDMPATVFVTPGLLGGHTYWWDGVRLADAEGQRFRTRALEEGAGVDARVRELAETIGVPITPAPAHAVSATEGEIDIALGAHAGLRLGSHSWSHPNLTRIDETRLALELTRSMAWLVDRYGLRACRVMSYPYGLFDARVVEAARRAGYEAALAIAGGWIGRSGLDPFRIPRLNIPAGLSPAGFRLRIDGVLGR